MIIHYSNITAIFLTQQSRNVRVGFGHHFRNMDLWQECVHCSDETLLLHNHRVPVCFPLIQRDNVHNVSRFLLNGCVGAILCTVAYRMLSIVVNMSTVQIIIFLSLSSSHRHTYLENPFCHHLMKKDKTKPNITKDITT